MYDIYYIINITQLKDRERVRELGRVFGTETTPMMAMRCGACTTTKTFIDGDKLIVCVLGTYVCTRVSCVCVAVCCFCLVAVRVMPSRNIYVVVEERISLIIIRKRPRRARTEYAASDKSRVVQPTPAAPETHTGVTNNAGALVVRFTTNCPTPTSCYYIKCRSIL